MKETWKDIAGYEGLYQVSNLGRVKSLKFRNNRGVKDRVRMMTPTDNGKGYLIVSFKVNGHRKNHYVHRLVAEHFVENLANCKYVNHIDYDTKNNRCDNLEWCTQQENVRYSAKNMRKPNSTPAKSATGEKYIYRRNNKFRVNYKGKDKLFLHLEDAVAYRNGVVGNVRKM